MQKDKQYMGQPVSFRKFQSLASFLIALACEMKRSSRDKKFSANFDVGSYLKLRESTSERKIVYAMIWMTTREGGVQAERVIKCVEETNQY